MEDKPEVIRYLLPLGIFALLVGVFAVGLQRDPKLVPSPLVGKAAPAFSLPRVEDPNRTLGLEDLRGKASLLNVWASWCVACRDEHPLLVQLARENRFPIYGLNYKDEREDAMRWLGRFGNPYTASAHDLSGKVGIDWGVYGVPETFVIDHEGFIRHKHIGPITPQVWEQEILPVLENIEAASS